MDTEIKEILRSPKRQLLVVIAAIGIALVYIYQQLISQCCGDSFNGFVFSRYIRVILNDLLMLIFLYGWFYDRQILRVAVFIQVIDLTVLMPLYLIMKLSIEGTNEISSPLLSQLHRVIVNPLLMILLIPAVYFQRHSQNKR